MKTINETNAQEMYVAPRAKVIVTRLEGLICSSPFDSMNNTELFSIDEEEEI